MSAPIVYRWDDGNAPVARGERGSLIEILTACLVTGYGEKPAAGWTREFVNAELTKAAFRNDPTNGTGFFLQVDELSSANAYTPKVAGYEAMSSENDGIGPFTASYQYSTLLSNTSGTTARPWILIADNRFFYFFCYTSSTSAPTTGVYPSSLLFGDIVLYDQNDAFGCMLFAHINTLVGISSAASAASEGATSFASPRPISGVATPTPMCVGRGGGPSGDTGAYGASGIAYSVGDPILYTRPYLNNKAAWTLRGWLPGFYYPCHPSPFGQLETVSIDSVPMVSIRGIAASQWGNWLVSTADWRA